MATDLTPEPAARRTAMWISLGLAIVVVGLVAVLATGTSATSRVTESPLIGRQVPAVAATTIDGEPFDLASLRGRWVIINFFATWCTPCREEHPDLVAFDERHQRIGDARVVGIIFDDDVDAIRQFREEEGGTWPMLDDPEGSLAVAFGVARVPESFLIAPNGTVVARLVGGVRDADLERLLAEASGADRDDET
jgi:cytochrome c biogenesis protein CcmG/thiol:disulfide interchange protein DsbE